MRKKFFSMVLAVSVFGASISGAVLSGSSDAQAYYDEDGEWHDDSEEQQTSIENASVTLSQSKYTYDGS